MTIGGFDHLIACDLNYNTLFSKKRQLFSHVAYYRFEQWHIVKKIAKIRRSTIEPQEVDAKSSFFTMTTVVLKTAEVS